MSISKTTANRIYFGSYLGIAGCLAGSLYFLANLPAEGKDVEQIVGSETLQHDSEYLSAEQCKDYSMYAVLLAGLFTGISFMAKRAYVQRVKEEKRSSYLNIERNNN